MWNRYIFFSVLFLIGSGLLANCTTDYFGLSSDKSEEAEEKPSHQTPLTYCNRFDQNNFRGLLTAYYSESQGSFVRNTNWLHLWEVPYEAQMPGNYVQFHLFRISNNKEHYHEAPVEADLIKHTSTEIVKIINSIDSDLLSELGGITMDHLLNRYSFLLKDIAGWHGLSISLFNAQNKPTKITKVMIAPFETIPKTYVANNDHEVLLLKLHPFGQLTKLNEHNDKVLYSKGVDNCNDSPIPLLFVPDATEFNFDEQLTTKDSVQLPDLNTLFK